jgi:uncharacterized protein
MVPPWNQSLLSPSARSMPDRSDESSRIFMGLGPKAPAAAAKCKKASVSRLHSAGRPCGTPPVASFQDGGPTVVASLMLELRPGCECCDRDLPPESPGVRICSFECTFCVECAERRLFGRCPNCGGDLVPRPRRSANKLANNPPSPHRVYKPAGCPPSA